MTSLKDPRIRTTIPPLTGRQREVLTLLARGYSNPQIGDTLGISLDGAKWHVSEILARLGVDTREEAAACWRDYNRPTARLARFARAVVPVATWAKWGAAVAGVGAVSAIAVVTVVAMNAGGPDTHLAAMSSVTGTASAQTTAAAQPTKQGTTATNATAIPGTPSPSATAPSTSPSASPTPPPALTKIPSVDAAIAAVEARDYASLAKQLITRNMQCGVTPAADSWAFDCPTGVAAGTAIAVYTTAGCDHPTYLAANTAAVSLADQVSGRAAIYAVVQDSDGTYRAIFKDDDASALTLTLTEAGITTVSRACGPSASVVLASADQSAILYRTDSISATLTTPATGVPAVDAAVAAIEAGEYYGVRAILATRDEPCGLNPPPADGWLSPCAPGVATGTVQAVYTLGGCDGPTWMPASTVDTTLAGIVSGTPHLYGVRLNSDATYSAVFEDNDPSAFTLAISNAGVTTISRACGAPASAVLAAGGTIIAGPFEQ